MWRCLRYLSVWLTGMLLCLPHEKAGTMSSMQWYKFLNKPAWTPDPDTISIIWQVLYPIIVYSWSFIFWKWCEENYLGALRYPSLSTLLEIVPLHRFFGSRSLILASINFVCVLPTLIWWMAMVWWYRQWVVIAQVIYVIWVTTATCLQLEKIIMNEFAP